MEYFEELELRFGNFKDLAESYPIWHGKHDEEQPELDRAVGHFKVCYIQILIIFSIFCETC